MFEARICFACSGGGDSRSLSELSPPSRFYFVLKLGATFWTMAVALVSANAAFAEFGVIGRVLQKDGAPFEIRGVCYQPTPVGDNNQLRAPFGDYFTGNYAALQDRDLPILRALGANAIRVYAFNPGADHQAFLDRCYNGGDHPLYVLVNYWIDPTTDWSDSTAVDALVATFTRIETETGDHPAVLATLLGNEANSVGGNGQNPAFWRAMDRIAAAIKAVHPSRLVSVPITDAPADVSAGEPLTPHLDFWSMQVYRYPTFGNLFTDFPTRSNRPLVLTEWGYDAFDHQAGAPYPHNGYFPGNALVEYWREIAAAADVCSGGCVFEYTDEWSKEGGDTTHDPGGWPNGFADGWGDEEWFGLMQVQPAAGGVDLVFPRASYAALSHEWNGDLTSAVAAQLTNLSTRCSVGTGADVAIAGFVIGGTVPKTVLIRASGPALSAYGVSGVLADPRLELRRADASSSLIATNDDWGADANTRQITEAALDGLNLPAWPDTSKDAALAVVLPPGGYTAVVSGANDSSGIALVEVFDVSPTETRSRLVNLSTRARVSSGDAVAISGFVISGSAPKTVLIRANGPALVNFGIGDALAHPTFELHNASALLQTVAGWDPALEMDFARLGIDDWTSGSTDAALKTTLTPGGYTVVTSGLNNTGGVSLLEVFEDEP